MTVDTSAAPGHGQIVCITGTGGFIASWLVKLLLERGYTVKGTVRNPDDPKNQHLKALDGAAERLVLCKADLTDYDGYGMESWARGSSVLSRLQEKLQCNVLSSHVATPENTTFHRPFLVGIGARHKRALTPILARKGRWLTVSSGLPTWL